MTESQPAGVTPTEQFLSQLCERSFLRLWSYANPYKDDGHEFCDLLAVFENHVFIFFDREKQLADFTDGDDAQVLWQRWKRGTIDKQINTAKGAERYLRSGRRIYLDAKKANEFPVPMDTKAMVVHKIIVAHGAAQACKNFAGSNVSGSLAICYGEAEGPDLWPFIVHLDRKDPVHVFDSHNLPIILRELDTVKDFSDYLDAKTRAIFSLGMLSYCGEEDLLAHYWLNLDPVSQKHYIGTSDPAVNAVIVEEGAWHDFIALPQYAETKRISRKSYFWDEIIQRTCDNWIAGKLLGDGQLLSSRGAIYEMAKEPRFMRRSIVERMEYAIRAFPDGRDGPARHLSFSSSYYSGKGYVFLQLWIPRHVRGDDGTYRAKRGEILRIACGAAKNHNPDLQAVVGICIPPPKLEREIGEDFVYLDCHEWSDETRAEYDRVNADWNFFKTGLRHEKRIKEFALPPQPAKHTTSYGRAKVGRNDPCPCGSGKKFKKCHGP